MKSKLKKSKQDTLTSVNLKDLIYKNLTLYGFVAYKTIDLNGKVFDIVASNSNTTIYLITYSLHKTHSFNLKKISDEEHNFFTRLVKRNVECGIAIQIDEGLIFYLPYSLVVASGERNLSLTCTQLDLLNTHLNKWRTYYENYNKEQH